MEDCSLLEEPLSDRIASPSSREGVVGVEKLIYSPSLPPVIAHYYIPSIFQFAYTPLSLAEDSFLVGN